MSNNDLTIHFDNIELVPMSPAMAEDAALQLEREFIDIVRQEIGMTELLAANFAQALVRGLRKRLGGSELWIPASSKQERDAAIQREFTGGNLEEVMRRHGVSRATVYRVAGKRKSLTSPLQVGR